MACDAAMAPVVTGDVNPAALEDLVRLCVQLDRLRHHPRTGPDDTSTGPDGTGAGGTASDGTGTGGDGPGTGSGADGTGGGQDTPAPDTTRAWEALERAIIGKAVDLLSGPGGLASFLRRRQLGARLAGPSLPLDIGYSETIPAGHPQRGDPAGSALPVGRAVQPARQRVPGAPRQAQEERRQDQHSRLCSTLLVSPSGRHPPVGVDAGPEPGRHHHRVEPGQNESPAQPRATRPGRVTPGVRAGRARPPGRLGAAAAMS